LIPVQIPPGLEAALDDAWHAARDLPGFLAEPEARFLGMLAACAPCAGVIVEIGSFKGKSASAPLSLSIPTTSTIPN